LVKRREGQSANHHEVFVQRAAVYRPASEINDVFGRFELTDCIRHRGWPHDATGSVRKSDRRRVICYVMVYFVARRWHSDESQRLDEFRRSEAHTSGESLCQVYVRCSVSNALFARSVTACGLTTLTMRARAWRPQAGGGRPLRITDALNVKAAASAATYSLQWATDGGVGG
jgi:hypothetical protein